MDTICKLLFMLCLAKSFIRTMSLTSKNIPNAFLFTKTTNFTLTKGSYFIRVLVVGGGGAGCTSNQAGWGEAGEVTVDVVSLTIQKNEYHSDVIVGHGGEVSNVPAGSASPPLPDNTRSSGFGARAEGGSCTTKKMQVNPQHFEQFFISAIAYGSSGNNTSIPGTSHPIRGGEGGILINNTGPTAHDGKYSYSSGGGVGYGAGGGSAGKAGPNSPLASDSGNGAPGLVYIEVVPQVCREAVRVMFAVDSTFNLLWQQDILYYLIKDYFYISKDKRDSTRVSVMTYRNQTAVEIKFNQPNIEEIDHLGFSIMQIKGVKHLNSTKVNFNNVFKTALKEFKDSDQHSDSSFDDRKTLVILTHEGTITANEQLVRLKKEFETLGIKILVIGLAENLPPEELAKLASNKGYVFVANGGSRLANSTNSKVKIANLICRAPSYRKAGAMSTTKPLTTRPYAKDETLNDLDYLLSYDLSKSDPYNVKQVKRILAIAGKVIRNSHKIPNVSRIAPGLKVLTFLEDYGLSLAGKLVIKENDSTTYKTYQQDDIDMSVLQATISTLDKLDIPSHNGEGDHVSLPREAFGQTDRGSVVVLTLNPVLSMKQINISMLSKKMMSIKIKPKAKNPFDKPVSLKFAVNEVRKERHQASCEFWNLSKRSSLSSHGAWSTKGCKVLHDNKTSVTCQCDHLTSFAVLMRIYPRKEAHDYPGEHDKYLSVITYIGCSLSILGCILTIVIHACLPSLRTERTFIHLNLVSAILIAQCLFFIAASIKGPKGLCFAVAIGLYLFYLCVFTWMLVEGLHIYCLVIRVFHSGHERKRLYAVIGWVVPVVLTIVCAASFREDFVAHNICWLSTSSGAIWAFVGPALVIIAVNLVILVLVLRVTATVMLKDETQNNSNQLRHLNSRGIQFLHEECMSKSLVRACITLLPILGLTWLFGILAINNKTIVFEYLFCIFNSIQGLLVFFFYCIGSSEVRREVKRKVHNYETKRSLRSSSTGFKSPKQNNSTIGKTSIRSAELISQKDYNEDTRL